MKYVSPYSVGLLFMAAASTSSASESANQPMISGQIEGAGVATIKVNSSPPLIGDDWSVPEHEDDRFYDVDATGAFRIPSTDSSSPFHRITLDGQTIEVFARPGDRVRLTVPSGEASPVSFAGDQADANIFLADVELAINAALQQLRETFRTLFAQDKTSFDESIRELEAPVLAKLGAFDAQGAGPSEVSKRAHIDFAAAFSRYRMLYPSLHHELTGQIVDVDKTFLAELAGDLLDQPAALSSRRLVTMLNLLVDLESSRAQGILTRNAPREKLMSRYQAIRNLPAHEDIKSYLYDQMFRHFRVNYGPADWGPVLRSLEGDDPEHPLLTTVKRQYDQDMADRQRPDAIENYRVIDGADLEAHIFYPTNHQPSDRRAAYLAFHGGGWAIGTPEWSYSGAERMAEQGMVAISFEYRLADVHGSNMFDCIEDVKAAIRWAREEAGRLGIDPGRVVAAGFSAGAHLSAASILVNTPDSDQDDRSHPNALIMHSSSYNTTKSQFFEAMTNNQAKSVSLLHNARSGLVPTIAFHGKHDYLAPLAEFTEFAERMEQLENDFEYHLFDVGHFFRDDEARKQVNALTDAFLVKHGFLKSPAR